MLVHGAFADASGWNGVTARLQAGGYPVLAWSNPMRDLTSDSAALTTFLSTVTGPIVLVGHSYGGAVITQMTGNSHIKALVYVTGYALAKDENVFAASALGGAQSTLGEHLVFRPIPGAGPENADAYVDPAYFHHLVAGDLSKRRSAVLAASQRPAAVTAFSSPSRQPAWATIPSYYLIATRDNAILPKAQAAMAERAGAKTTKVAGSHFVMLSHPKVVADFVRKAATGG
ncbi:alpha/beta hydrolase [Nocardioides sp. URHA0020]|uniref:alpha/beta hydrolase n=1 Tax=Nocardioides sp. URHA0020 TaxID=1380392 RepID=UPI000AA84368|nr:alpha/beta hydrolase [Nocardioides sp. URHA0020]